MLLIGCGSAEAGKTSTSLGINVAGIQGGVRPFMNLIYGSSWMMRDVRSGSSTAVPAESLDDNGWVKSVPAGFRVTRSLPALLNPGKFICRYQGNGTLEVSGAAVSNVSGSAGATRFSLAGTYPNPQTATLSYAVDPANYIRDVDCRETDASTTEAIAPEFLSALRSFHTIRFMKWQTAAEENRPVSWATRNKPGDGDYTGKDGVPVEVLVSAANEAGSDLWVTMPWNADDDYLAKFATYVRDHLSTGHHVYVEVSNEVWNGSYPVVAQATREARAEGLPSASGSGLGGNLERYAEKTKQVMAIWARIFSGQSARLVRVASLQHVAPYFSDLLLRYMNLSKSVDALATAPYFGYEAKDGMPLDQIMAALPNEVSTAIDFGRQQKAIAQKYGLRYLAYEGGQSVVLPDVALEERVQRDPRMHVAYAQFLSGWNAQVGDTLNLFALDGQISRYGGWGLSEYVGQPVSQAPKLRAVNEFLGIAKPR